MATTSPPRCDASGPISIIWSACLIIISSCSTTTTVLPSAFNSCNTPISLSVSLECRPIEGSSKMYKEFVRLLPKLLVNCMRWLSPPLKEFANLLSVRYPKPTSSNVFRRLSISIKILLPTVLS